MATFLACGRRGCKHEVSLLYVHRQITSESFARRRKEAPSKMKNISNFQSIY